MMEFHQPVLVKEVCTLLEPSPGKIFVDATIGLGGHSKSLIKLIQPGGRLIGIDWDKDSLELARKNLSIEGIENSQVNLFYDNFINLGRILESLKIKAVDGIILDLGVSSYQLSVPERGFSFQVDGPLDMRMDKKLRCTAKKIINCYPMEELIQIFRNYGEERFSRRIARMVVERRKQKPIESTVELVNIIQACLPSRKHRTHIHPATRIFQALRIAVNQELTNLAEFLKDAPGYLAPKGRLAVISFHSLEDRLVKEAFRRNKLAGVFKIITPKPIRPSLEEIRQNPRSRSARLRVAEKLGESNQ